MTNESVTGRRIVAAIIDALLMTGLFIAMSAATDNLETGDGEFKVSLEGGAFVLFLAIQLAYFWVLETVVGKTIGKALVGIKVVAEDGSKASGGSVAVRTVLRIVDALPILYVVGLISIAVSGKDQRVGDRVANTLVVKG